MKNIILSLALLLVGCGDGSGVAYEGAAVDVASAAVAGGWTCQIDGTTLSLRRDGTYEAPTAAGTYAAEGNQITFSGGLAGFCQLDASTGTFWFNVASSTSDLTDAVLRLYAPGEVCPLDRAR